MSVKQVKVVIPGSGITAHVGVAPETTAGDVLADVGAQGNVNLARGYVLSPQDGRGFFRTQDRLDPVVNDGDVLSVNPWAKVGSDAASALAAAVVAGCALVLLVALIACWPKHRPKDTSSSAVKRANGAAPELWEQLGWKRSGDLYSGHYVLDRLRLPGKVSFRTRWRCGFRVWAPAKLIAACGRHRGCFIGKSKLRSDGWRWFSIHFQRRPGSVSEGILAVQEMLNWGAGRLREGVA